MGLFAALGVLVFSCLLCGKLPLDAQTGSVGDVHTVVDATEKPPYRQLTITAKRFHRQVCQSVQVQTGRDTEVRSTLKVGATTETVQVETDATRVVEQYIAGNGLAGANKMAPQNVAGEYLYGPSWYNIDLSVMKTLPIRENLRFTFPGTFLNTLNQTTFGPVTSGASVANIQSQTLGQTTGGPSRPRVVELRANLEW
jgi:hypothetical protein